jgi:hypothetical protein
MTRHAGTRLGRGEPLVTIRRHLRRPSRTLTTDLPCKTRRVVPLTLGAPRYFDAGGARGARRCSRRAWSDGIPQDMQIILLACEARIGGMAMIFQRGKRGGFHHRIGHAHFAQAIWHADPPV